MTLCHMIKAKYCMVCELYPGAVHAIIHPLSFLDYLLSYNYSKCSKVLLDRKAYSKDPVKTLGLHCLSRLIGRLLLFEILEHLP